MRPLPLYVAALTLATGGAAVSLAVRPDRPSAPPGMSELAGRNTDIAFFEARVRHDPRGAADRAFLAGLYLQRARETGAYADFVRAESTARAALAIRPDRNTRALLALASSLLGQHRFAEARTWAECLVAATPEGIGARALLGEIQLELGDYDAAGRTFGSLSAEASNLAVAPRLARWAELRGRPDEAHALLVGARSEALRRVDLPREQVSWFQLRVADLALRFGRLVEADRALTAGLRAEPGDYRLLAAKTRSLALRGRWRAALRWGARAEAAGADIATLALIGDVWGARGDSVRARSYWDEAEQAAFDKPEPYNRQWTLFRLDHGIALDSTRAILEREITGRRDVYGWDQLAWARHLTGDRYGARAAMREALRMGTQDAMLQYHAGLIALADADSAGARRALERALAINPRFHWTQADAARALLGRL